MTARSLVSVALLTVGALLASAGPLHAAGEVGLSTDGSTWSTSLPAPLFDPAFRWVPGDDETSSFFVRNQGPSTARLTLSVRSADTDQLLGNEDFRLLVRADGGPWRELANGVPSAALTERAISRSGVVRVDVRVQFDPAAVNPTQNTSAALAFDVTLTESLPSAPPTPDDEDADDSDDSDDDADDSDDFDDSDGGNSTGGLADTGSSLTPAALWTAAILIGGGLALVRRTEHEDAADV